jgi:ABC-type uncharacterized transport system substrate-binding protein
MATSGSTPLNPAPPQPPSLPLLATSAFYTRVAAGERVVALRPPTEFAATYEGGRIVLRMSIPLADPLPAVGRLSIDAVDPGFETFFEWHRDLPPFTATSMPEGCDIRRRAADDAPVNPAHPIDLTYGPVQIVIDCPSA